MPGDSVRSLDNDARDKTSPRHTTCSVNLGWARSVGRDLLDNGVQCELPSVHRVACRVWERCRISAKTIDNGARVECHLTRSARDRAVEVNMDFNKLISSAEVVGKGGSVTVGLIGIGGPGTNCDGIGNVISASTDIESPRHTIPECVAVDKLVPSPAAAATSGIE